MRPSTPWSSVREQLELAPLVVSAWAQPGLMLAIGAAAGLKTEP